MSTNCHFTVVCVLVVTIVWVWVWVCYTVIRQLTVLSVVVEQVHYNSSLYNGSKYSVVLKSWKLKGYIILLWYKEEAAPTLQTISVYHEIDKKKKKSTIVGYLVFEGTKGYFKDLYKLASSPGSPIFSVCNIEKLGIGPGNEASIEGFSYSFNFEGFHFLKKEKA